MTALALLVGAVIALGGLYGAYCAVTGQGGSPLLALALVAIGAVLMVPGMRHAGRQDWRQRDWRR